MHESTLSFKAVYSLFLPFIFLLLTNLPSSTAQVNYEAGRNLREWVGEGNLLLDSHEWFGDTLVLVSLFSFIFDTVETTQGDTTFTVIRRGTAQGIHIYPDEYQPATINIVDTAYVPHIPPVEYQGKMYWVARKSWNPPDTSSWLVLYEFDPKTLEVKNLTLHDANASFHYVHDLVVDGDLLSAITRASFHDDDQYYLNIIDPASFKLVAHATLEWTTGTSTSTRTRRLFTSDINIVSGDTTIVFSGFERTNESDTDLFFKTYDLNGNELDIQYIGNSHGDQTFRDHRNYNRSILAQRSDSNLFFLTTHVHEDYVADSTNIGDFKAFALNPINYEKLDSSDIGDPNYWEHIQSLMDYTVVGDTLVAVGQYGDLLSEFQTSPGDSGYIPRNQLGVLAYDMNTLELLWKKRFIQDTIFLSQDYGVSGSPHNFVSATAMVKSDDPDEYLDIEVRIIHLNRYGCPTGDPNATCDDLIWLDRFVSSTEDPNSVEGVVPGLEVRPSLLSRGTVNSIQFYSKALAEIQPSTCTIQLFDSNGRLLEQKKSLSQDYSFTVPAHLSSGLYYAYLRSGDGRSIGVGKFVVQ